MIKHAFVPSVLVALMLTSSQASAQERRFTSVDLSDKFTHKLANVFGSDGREGNFLTIPQGDQSFAEVRFKIGDGVLQLGSKVWTTMPESIEGIKVGHSLSKLHLLHATGYGGGPNVPGTPWHVEDDTEIGEYRVHYDDGTTATIPIVYGKDVRDWWFRENEPEPSRSKVAWKGANDLAASLECRLRVYLTTWDNPKPDKKVTSIDYVARKEQTVATPFCLAITTETTERGGLSVGAASLVEVFLTNEARADEQYAGKIIEVSGRVARVARSKYPSNEEGRDTYVVEMDLEGAGRSDKVKLDLLFFFGDKDRKQLADLQPGRFITVRGKCGQRIIWAGEARSQERDYSQVRLHECSIVNVRK